jgi:rSAM/selenodomain-associated transferase 2
MKCPISVIMPVWNETEETLIPTLERARQIDPESEIILCDAGGRDGFSHVNNLARAFHATHLTSARRQRAAQMNLAAASAAGDVFLFLHADTLLPSGAFAEITRAFLNPDVGGGAFERVFDSNSIWLKCSCRLAAFRNHLVGWHLGDQALFVRRNLFQEMNGFPLFDRFEDLEFSRRLAGRSKVVTLHSRVVSSARRFERNGALRQTIRDFMLTMKYLRGDPAAIYNNGVPPKTSNTASYP